jgi:hypothetical protein
MKMRNIKRFFVTQLIAINIANFLYSQTPDLKLVDWQPVSQLVVKETKIKKAKFPVINFPQKMRSLKRVTG